MSLEKRIKVLTRKHLTNFPLSNKNDAYQIIERDNTAYLDYYFSSMKNYKAYLCLYFDLNQKIVEINNIYIIPQYRSYNLGARLVNIVEVMAADFKAKTVFAVNSVNDTFWEHMRYDKVDEFDFAKPIFF
ncbi:hypothetical protein D6777_04260 [Candidatus Woesearchaeota archaeon]|nr:MAG: hypothetical protein D6777_04260 [Candidatus Woesearchaeota archaeon]